MNKEIITSTEKLLNNVAWMTGDIERIKQHNAEYEEYLELHPTPQSAGASC